MTANSGETSLLVVHQRWNALHYATLLFKKNLFFFAILHRFEGLGN